MKTNNMNNNENKYFNAEQLYNAFKQLKTVEELRQMAGGMVAEINAAAKIRFEELKPTTEGTTSISINAKPQQVEEAEAEEIVEKPKHGRKSTKKAATTTKSEHKETKQLKIASLTKADIKKMDIHFYQYSEKCVLLRGETKAIKDDIMETTGSHSFRENYGWFLKNDKGHALAKAMGCRVVKDENYMKKAK
jgi:hypothetical protein